MKVTQTGEGTARIKIWTQKTKRGEDSGGSGYHHNVMVTQVQPMDYRSSYLEGGKSA